MDEETDGKEGGIPESWMWRINGALTGLTIVFFIFLHMTNKRLEYVEVGRVGSCEVTSIEPTEIDCPDGFPSEFFGFLYLGEMVLCKEYEHRIPGKFVTDYKCFIREPW